MDSNKIIHIPDSPTPSNPILSHVPVESQTGGSPSPIATKTRKVSYFKVIKRGVIVIYDSDGEGNEAASKKDIHSQKPPLVVKADAVGPSNRKIITTAVQGSESSTNKPREPIRQLFQSISFSTSSDSSSVNQYKYW